MKVEVAEAAAAKIGSTATVSGMLTTWFAWVTSNEGLGVLGLLVALVGLLVTWHYKRESDRRQKAEALERKAERELRMSLMRASGRPIFHEDTDLGRLEPSNE